MGGDFFGVEGVVGGGVYCGYELYLYVDVDYFVVGCLGVGVVIVEYIYFVCEGYFFDFVDFCDGVV